LIYCRLLERLLPTSLYSAGFEPEGRPFGLTFTSSYFALMMSRSAMSDLSRLLRWRHELRGAGRARGGPRSLGDYDVTFSIQG
jgi:hypothetical protein